MHPDSTESSATSTGTIILNQNALKPKNSQTQTHSVSQMSLQTTGITGCGHNNHPTLTTSTHKSQINHSSPKIQCSYPTLASASSCNKEQQPPSQQQQVYPQQLQIPSTTNTSTNSSSSSSCSNSISSSTSISTINTTTSNALTGTYTFFDVIF